MSGTLNILLAYSTSTPPPPATWVEVDGGFDSSTAGFDVLAMLSSSNAGTIDLSAANIGITTNSGTTWTLETTPTTFFGVIASGSNYIGFTANPYDAYYSSDGITWTAVGNAPVDTAVTFVMYDETSQTLLFIIDNAVTPYYVIGSTSGAGGNFVIAGDETSIFTNGTDFGVSASSTVNNGSYTVASTSFDGTNTTVVVTGSVPVGGQTDGVLESATVSIWRLPAGATSFTQTLSSAAGPNYNDSNNPRSQQYDGIWLAAYINDTVPALYTYQSTDNGVTWTALSGLQYYQTGPYAWNGTTWVLQGYQSQTNLSPQAPLLSVNFYYSTNLSTWTLNNHYPFTTGAIEDFSIPDGGTGYDGGGSNTYYNVPLTGGTGSGATATVTVTLGVVTNVVIAYTGSGYLNSDTMSASNTHLGGSGSGLSLTVVEVDQQVTSFLVVLGTTFIATSGGDVSYSTDGNTWSTAALPTGLTFIRGLWVNGSKVYAIGDGISSSLDGITWLNELTSLDYIIGWNFGNYAYSQVPLSNNSGGYGYVDNAYTISNSVSGAGGTFTLSPPPNTSLNGDYTSLFTTSTSFMVVGDYAYGNDGSYTVASSLYDAVNHVTIVTVNETVNGSGENVGYAVITPYANVPLTGGHGVGAQATFYVNASMVNYITTITDVGSGYLVGDVLTASNSYLGGTGSGFEMNVSSAILLNDIANYGSTFLAVGQQPTSDGTYDGENGIWRHS